MKRSQIAIAAVIICQSLLALPAQSSEKKETTTPIESRVIAALDYVDKNGSFIDIKKSTQTGEVYKVDILTFLMEQGLESDAVKLIESGSIDGWMVYNLDGAVVSPFQYALAKGHSKFLLALFKFQPDKLNTEFVISSKIPDKTVLPLAVVASVPSEITKADWYNIVVTAMLNAGASPNKEMKNGASPLLVASSKGNYPFVKAVRIHDSLRGDRASLMTNTSLTQVEIAEEQAIVDAWVEREAQGKNNYSFNKLYDLYTKMIIKGYNRVAKMMHTSLTKDPKFDINSWVGSNPPPILSASISSLAGGNVEYAQFLIERGANINSLYGLGEGDTSLNLIQTSLKNDNYKIVALLIKNGVNFITVPETDDLIYTEALALKAYRSSVVIREAMKMVSTQEI
jgi:hypothetical protein